MTSSYRFRTALVVRLVGVGLVATGVLAFAFLVLGGVLGEPTLMRRTGLPVVLVVLGVLAVLAVVVSRVAVVTLGESGYRVRFLRGAGVRAERWTSVEDVVTAVVGGARCIVLRLRDGRSTVLPVAVLAASPDAFVADLREHLDRGHGYRPLPRRSA